MLMVLPLVAIAQDNLVPNSTFQHVEKKVKEFGQLELAIPWVSPTLAKADLFTSNAKNELLGTPENSYGEEKPMEGDNYAGFLAYSDNNKKPRSYLQVQLTQKLEAGKTYCVTMHVSLADLSKFATNYIGMTLTKNALSANNTDVLKIEKQIVSKKLTTYEQQFYWAPICGVFKAQGGEEYLTIGNFTESEKLNFSKVKRPRGMNEPQKPEAYYYVDNVSVVETTSPSKCDCDIDPAMRNAEVVNRNFKSDSNPSANTVKIVGSEGTSVSGKVTSKNPESLTKINGLTIEFQAKSYSITESTKKLDMIVAYLKANPTVKISVVGHIDKSEKAIDKLDGKRANSVFKYLISKGINAERVSRSVKADEQPIDAKDPLKNMRVEIIEE